MFFVTTCDLMYGRHVTQEFKGAVTALLGGSWYLLTSYNCTYNPLISPFKCPNVVIRTVISTVTIC